MKATYAQEASEYFNRASHGCLYVDGLHIVPAFFEQRDQEVERHDDVGSEFLIGHLLVADSDVHVGDLLQLPLNGGLDVVELLVEWLGMGHWSWESTDSVKNWTEDNWDLLNEGVGGEKKIVLLELLQVVKGRDFDLSVSAAFGSDTKSLGFVLMLLIGNDADLEVWSWHVGQSDATSETLVFLWIVILKSNLELNSLEELSLLGL